MAHHPEYGCMGIFGRPATRWYTHPFVKNGLFTNDWRNMHTARNSYDFSVFQRHLDEMSSRGRGCGFGAYVQGHNQSCPTWLSSHGVPVFPQPTSRSYYYAYLLDPQLFPILEDFIQRLVEWMSNQPDEKRQYIRFIKGLYGSSGDQSAYYHNDESLVPSDYRINPGSSEWRQFKQRVISAYDDALEAAGNLAHVALHVKFGYKPNFNEWGDAVNIEWPWLMANIAHKKMCKMSSIGHRTTLNSESHTYAFNEQYRLPAGVESREEIDQNWRPNFHLYSFAQNIYWHILANLAFRNQYLCLKPEPDRDRSIFHPQAAYNCTEVAAEFFNEHAPYMIDCAGITPKAWIAFRDAPDAADTDRFPESEFGQWHVSNYGSPMPGFRRPAGAGTAGTNGNGQANLDRARAIANRYSAQGAKIPDPDHFLYERVGVWQNSEEPNDVNWEIFPGNYEFYLTQIDPNGTSDGWWRVGGDDPANRYDVSRRFGRWARSPKPGQAIRIAAHNDFMPAGAASAVEIDVIYYDDNYGQWRLRHIDSGRTLTVRNENTRGWKTATLSVSNATFSGSGGRGEDLVLETVLGSPTKFHMVMVKRLGEPTGPVLAPIGNRNLLEGATLSIDISASDPGGVASLSADLSALPNGHDAALVDNGDGTATLSWNTQVGHAGVYPVTITATGSSGQTDSETVQIGVQQAASNVSIVDVIGTLPPAYADELFQRSFNVDVADGHEKVYVGLSYEGLPGRSIADVTLNGVSINQVGQPVSVNDGYPRHAVWFEADAPEPGTYPVVVTGDGGDSIVIGGGAIGARNCSLVTPPTQATAALAGGDAGQPNISADINLAQENMVVLALATASNNRSSYTPGDHWIEGWDLPSDTAGQCTSMMMFRTGLAAGDNQVTANCITARDQVLNVLALYPAEQAAAAALSVTPVLSARVWASSLEHTVDIGSDTTGIAVLLGSSAEVANLPVTSVVLSGNGITPIDLTELQAVTPADIGWSTYAAAYGLAQADLPPAGVGYTITATFAGEGRVDMTTLLAVGSDGALPSSNGGIAPSGSTALSVTLAGASAGGETFSLIATDNNPHGLTAQNGQATVDDNAAQFFGVFSLQHAQAEDAIHGYTDSSGSPLAEVVVGFSPAHAQSVNSAPEITSDGGGVTAAVTIMADQVDVTTVSATDPDNDVLTYTISGGADGALFSVDSASGALRFLAAQPVGLYEVAVQVSDGRGGTDSQTISVTVEEEPRTAPAMDPIGSVYRNAGIPVSVPVSASSEDGSIPALSASGLPENATFEDHGDGTGTVQWLEPVVGISSVTVTATDAIDPNLSDSVTFSIVILAGKPAGGDVDLPDVTSDRDYLEQLRALLPMGRLWDSFREGSEIAGRVLSALTREFGRVDARAEGVIDETDPRTMYELLPEWEEFADLPEPCDQAAGTLEERRQALQSKLVNRGGQSRAFFIELAARHGYQIEIEEYEVTRTGARLGARTQGEDWAHAWAVIAPEVTIRSAAVGRSMLGERLNSWGNDRLECVIKIASPAQTILRFKYGGEDA